MKARELFYLALLVLLLCIPLDSDQEREARAVAEACDEHGLRCEARP